MDDRTKELYNFAETTPVNMNEYYTIKETCELLKLSKPSIYRLINDGKILTIKLSERGTRVIGSSIIAFLYGVANGKR